MLERLTGWDGDFLAARHDAPTGAWMLVGVHSTVLGPGLGGTRMKPYAAPEDAVTDVLRLARAMTYKNAVAGIGFGGGKAVIAVPVLPTGEDRTALLERYGDLVSSLRGAYVTACDMNTTEDDMDVIGRRTEHVMGMSESNGGSGTSAPDTALGVRYGIGAALRHVFGDGDLGGRRVAVQGAGAVGSRLVELLVAEGADVVVADVDAARAEAVAALTGATVESPDAIITTRCDVFAPCATGQILHEQVVEHMRCAIVAGAANNQLADAGVAAQLADKGIVYAPDYVVNAGGVLHLAGYERLGWSPDEMVVRLAGIGDTLGEVFRRADEDGVTTTAAAQALALEAIAAHAGS